MWQTDTYYIPLLEEKVELACILVTILSTAIDNMQCKIYKDDNEC